MCRDFGDRSFYRGFKRFMVTATIVVGIAVFASVGSAAPPEGVVVTKFGSVLAENHAHHQSYVYFADRVKELTKGKLIINVYPNSQLGNEREYVEFLQTGQIEFARVASAVLGSFIPQFQVFDIPYLFKEKQQMFKAADGELGKVLMKALADKLQIKGLGFFDDGTRCLFNSKRPIYTPADFKGLKVRTMENKLMIQTFNMLGAAATPLPFSELYSALQQGVVDAGEAPVPSYWAMKFNEVAKYYSYTDTFIAPAIPMVSLKWYNAQPKEFQQAIDQAAKDMIVKERQLMADQDKTATEDLKKKGALFNHVKDKNAFVKVVEPIHKEYETKLGKALLDLARNPK
ncbi:MAG: TRAP transporter substrate-binding protein [Deltaproteobacteria bacterium]|nr:TRAP transporter substrate-binding protein [Deltaproteobacteria bacterium]